MRSRGILASLSISLLLGSGAAAVAPASAADSTAVITAAANGPGENPARAELVVLPGGNNAVTVTSAGMTKWALTPGRITRLGTLPMPAVADDPSSVVTVLAHPAGRYVYVVSRNRVQVFDAAGRTPKQGALVRVSQMKNGTTTPTIEAAVFGPHGGRLYLQADETVRTLSTGTRPAPRVGRAFATGDPVFGSETRLAVTADNQHLVVTGSAGGQATVAVYALTDPAALTLERQAPLVVPGWPTTGLTSTGTKVVIGPGGKVAFVEVRGTVAGVDGRSVAIARVQVADAATSWLPARTDALRPYLGQVSASGGRVYLLPGADQDASTSRTSRSLGWADAAATEQHDVLKLGAAHDLVVSRAGKTKGLVYVVVRKSPGYRLESVRVR